MSSLSALRAASRAQSSALARGFLNSVSSRSLHASARTREHYLDATPQVFEKQVLKPKDPNRLILVDFYANWCGPCKTLSPALEKITSDTTQTDGQEVDLVTVDTDVETDLAQRYQIRSLPTVTAFKGGKPLGHFVGAIPPAMLKKAVNDWLKATH
ncbi:hypothetical protein FRC03_012639 [Tulasnella sp. 419]|nr:hypothetical protein FRC03_012639 [Tulasnella sp. 419]